MDRPDGNVIGEIKARLAKLPPGFLTRGALGETRSVRFDNPEENCQNTIMDCNGKIICDSLNADLRMVEQIDPERNAWRDVGTLAYFDFLANAKEDVEWLLAENERLRAAMREGE